MNDSYLLPPTPTPPWVSKINIWVQMGDGGMGHVSQIGSIRVGVAIYTPQALNGMYTRHERYGGTIFTQTWALFGYV